jgi:hypothetical protein
VPVTDTVTIVGVVADARADCADGHVEGLRATAYSLQ